MNQHRILSVIPRIILAKHTPTPPSPSTTNGAIAYNYDFSWKFMIITLPVILFSAGVIITTFLNALISMYNLLGIFFLGPLMSPEDRTRMIAFWFRKYIFSTIRLCIYLYLADMCLHYFILQ